MKFYSRFALLCLLSLAGVQRLACAAPKMKTFDLTALQDDQRVLSNPHKGWYHHYYDNGLDNYPSPVADIEAVPGMNHLYLRLAWSYLEPREGVYNWKLLDDVIAPWTARGYGIAVRVTCKESDAKQPFATPQWVKDAGAKGRMVSAWNSETWRPDYGDPIFLAALERFHKAFAARYDGASWLEYVDIGSYGQWGEGHNFMAGGEPVEVDIVEQHIALFKRQYKRTTLVISDDVVGNAPAERADEMAAFIAKNNIAVRDDSIGVGWFVQNYANSVRSPQLFAGSFKHLPVVLELDHYNAMKRQGDIWMGADGQEHGAAMLEGAIRTMHASYIGYHGDAATWLRDNPNLTRRMANLCGYWYFLDSGSWPVAVSRKAPFKVSLTWLNRGVAPAYTRFDTRLRLRLLQGGTNPWTHQLSGSDNRQWMPDIPFTSHEELMLPATLQAGKYAVEIALFDQKRPVQLAIKQQFAAPDGFYRIGEVTLTP